MFFKNPGQYRVYIISWIPLIAVSLVLAVGCFFIGKWTSKSQPTDLSEINQQITKLKIDLQEAKDEVQRTRDDVLQARNDASQAKDDASQAKTAVVNSRTSIEKQILDLNNNIGKIDFSTIKTRQALIGALMNENYAAIAAGKPQDCIYFDRNWKINRMPKYLDMNRADMDWMMQFLNREAALVPQVPGAPRMPQP